MGLFDSNGSLLGGTSNDDNSKKSGSAPSPAPPMHLLGGLHLDPSGVDASGVDASGGPGYFARIGKTVGIGLAAGLGVALYYASSLNLIYLSDPAARAVAEAAGGGATGGGKTTGSVTAKVQWVEGKIEHFKDRPAILPFIPCNFEWLQTLFHVKPWVAGTLLDTWKHSRGFLSTMMNFIGKSSHKLIIPLGFMLMCIMLAFVPLVSIVFTIYSSFKNNVGWSILGTILGILPLMTTFIVLGQLGALMYYFASPMLSQKGRTWIGIKVEDHKKMLRLIYLLIVIGLSFLEVPPLVGLGMFLGLIVFGR